MMFSPELRKDPKTPIVLVCHSVGGLIAKKAYLLAQQDPSCRHIADRCRSMIFLATPHRGSDTALTLNRYLKAMYVPTPNPFIADMERDSPSVRTINEEFRHVALRLKLYSFYETVRTNIGTKKEFVVPHDSAVLGYPNEISMPMHADHRSMCKFSSQQDSNYTSFRNVLAAIVGELSAENNASTTLTKRATLNLLRAHLDCGRTTPQHLQDVEIDKHTASIRWIRSQQAFERWLGISFDRNSHFLVLTAKFGAGKSVLASQIVHYLEVQGFDNGSFYFKSHVDRSQAVMCLKLLAVQLARVNERIARRLNDLKEEVLRCISNDTKACWNTLFCETVSQVDFPRPFYFVIDAIDECREAPLLLSLLLSQEAPPMLRVLMTCRTSQSHNIKLALERSQITMDSLEMSPVAINEDIQAFVTEKITDLRWKEDEVSGAVEREVLQRSLGCFQWVKLIFEGLQQAYTAHSIQEVLESVPEEMAQSYHKALSDATHRCRERRLLASSLAWAVFSPGILSVAELQKILEEDLGERVFRLKEFLQDFCGGFLHVDLDDRITFVHATARKFLIDSQGSNLLDR